MKGRAFRIVVAVVAVVVAAAVILEVAVYSHASREGHRAERVLAAVAKLEPGVTSAAEIERDVLPLDSQFGSRCGSPTEAAARYAGFWNIPFWRIFQNDHTPAFVRRMEAKWILPRATGFDVSLECESGLLSNLRVTEMQDSGWVHPYADATAISPKGTIVNAGVDHPSLSGRDYWVYERKTGAYQGSRLVEESPVLNRFVRLTPDATEEERRRAFDFHLDCFTRWSGCQDVDLILPAAPNRK